MGNQVPGRGHGKRGLTLLEVTNVCQFMTGGIPWNAPGLRSASPHSGCAARFRLHTLPRQPMDMGGAEVSAFPSHRATPRQRGVVFPAGAFAAR